MCNIVAVAESLGPNMNPGKHSFVKMPSAKISEMCEDSLQFIYQRRAEKKKRQIEDVRQSIVKRFWHRFWRRPVPTDEEIIDYLENSDYCLFYGNPDNLYWETEKLCHKLSVACKQVDEINISVSDLDQIS